MIGNLPSVTLWRYQLLRKSNKNYRRVTKHYYNHTYIPVEYTIIIPLLYHNYIIYHYYYYNHRFSTYYNHIILQPYYYNHIITIHVTKQNYQWVVISMISPSCLSCLQNIQVGCTWMASGGASSRRTRRLELLAWSAAGLTDAEMSHERSGRN